MGLLNRKANRDAGEKVDQVKFQVGLALLKMDKALKGVEVLTTKAKEELSGQRAG